MGSPCVARVPEYRVSSEPGWLSHSESSHWPRALWLFILGVRLPFVPHTAQMFNTFEEKHLISLSCSGEGKAAGLVQETTNAAAGFYQPQCTWSAWLLAACVFLCDLPRGSTLRWERRMFVCISSFLFLLLDIAVQMCRVLFFLISTSSLGLEF